MAPRDRDLFANFERMRREIDELFGDVFERSGLTPTRGFSPRVDVYYTGQPPTAIVMVDIAGVEVEGVSLEIHGRQLTIAGHRHPQESEGRLYQQIEIPHGPFRRVVELGADVQASAARATYEDGILRVEIPLVEQQGGGRRVPIEGRAPTSDRGEVPE
jgi:HSP20 family protein